MTSQRENLEWSVLRLGLETLQDWYRAGEFAKCRKLAGRLLEINPLDEGLHEYLIRTTHALEGSLLAARGLERTVRIFESEVGEIPPSILALKTELKLVS